MPAPLRFSPFVQVKAGTEDPPIFIAHGLSGTVQVSELARHIQTRHPIYGIQAKGIDGKEQPFRRVEDMATYYMDELEPLRLRNDSILIGYSFGGLVALEMAQTLLKNGKNVALLVLIDTFPHPRFMPLPWRVRLFSKRMWIHARQMRKMPLAAASSYFLKGIKRRLHLARALNDTEGLPETLSLSPEERALRQVNEKAYIAYASYRPKFYPGKIKFVATETKTFFPGDPAAIWGDLAADLEIEVIPGNHLNIVTTEFKGLVAVLTRYIQSL
jgi:acetoacetyl-CoA synthetase